MTPRIAKLPTRPRVVNTAQYEFELEVTSEANPEGFGMGVLENGTAFLTQRALADLCGVRNKYIGIISSEWNSSKPPKEVVRAKEMLFEQDGDVPVLPHIEVWEGKRLYFAYPASVCTVLLEYFAFEAKRQGEAVALASYRQISRHGLTRYIYDATGYKQPDTTDVWRVFKDRASLVFDAVPDGYFGVFREIASLIFTLGEAGLHIDEKLVPDISVGQAWAKHWEIGELQCRYGLSRTYEHNFPEYFPQSSSNPQMARCYPEEALGEFRRWFREDYVGEGRLKRYLDGKAKSKTLPHEYVERVMLAVTKEG